MRLQAQDAIITGGENGMGRAAMANVLAVYESAATGEWIEMGEK